MARHGQNSGHHHVFDFRVHALGRLDLLAGKRHGIVILLVRGLDIHKLAEPFS
jgi:hypothetical protein